MKFQIKDVEVTLGEPTVLSSAKQRQVKMLSQACIAIINVLATRGDLASLEMMLETELSVLFKPVPDTSVIEAEDASDVYDKVEEEVKSND